MKEQLLSSFKKREYYTLFCLFFLVIVANVLMSLFSPLNYTYFHVDQNMFFMCGKALAHGMIPYLDFADCKGPFLFFYYCLANILSPGELWGALLMSIIFQYVAFVFLFKIAKKLNGDDWQSLLACILTICVFYEPFTAGDGGGRAENLYHPFISATLYFYVSYLVAVRSGDNVELKNRMKQLGIAIGCALASALLIKYTFAVSSFVIVFLVFLYELKRKQYSDFIMVFISRICASFVLFVAPFCLYILIVGGWDSFIDVYFLSNFKFSTSGRLCPSTISEAFWRLYVLLFKKTHFVYLIMGGGIFLPRLFGGEKNDLVERISILSVYIITLISTGIFLWTYYVSLCAPFAIFGAIRISKLIKLNNKYSSFFICLIVFVFSLFFCRTQGGKIPFTWYKYVPSEILSLDKVVCRISTPKIIYVASLDLGLGVAAQALPACQYWAHPNKYDSVVIPSQRDAILKNKADFICLNTCHIEDSACFEWIDFIQKSGYTLISGEKGQLMLFSLRCHADFRTCVSS